jgi:hypothetical protein
VIDSPWIWKRCGFVRMISCGILLAGSFLALIAIHGLVFRPGFYCSAADLDRGSRLPLRAKLAGGISLILWLCVVTCGRWIAYYDAPQAIAAIFRP